MSSVRLFHDLPPITAPDEAIVRVGSFRQWWQQAVARRTIQVTGARSASVNGGAHFKLPTVEGHYGRAPYYDSGGIFHDWIQPMFEGMKVSDRLYVGYGTINPVIGARVPTIGGLPIDTLAGLPLEDRPSLEWRADGIVAAEVSLRFTHGTIPANGSAGTAHPTYSSTAAWNAWPEVKWATNITPTSPTSPPTGTFTDAVMSVPLLRVKSGRIYRLSWEGYFFNRTFVSSIA